MKTDTTKKRSRKKISGWWKALIAAIPILTGLILAIAQLIGTLGWKSSPTPTPTPTCQFFYIDTQNTSITVTEKTDRRSTLLFRGISGVSPKNIFVVDLETDSREEIGKIKFRIKNGKIEIFSVVTPSCKNAPQAGIPLLESIYPEADGRVPLSLNGKKYELYIFIAKDDNDTIQGRLISE